MFEKLLENETFQILGAIAFVLSAAYAFFRGMFEKKQEYNRRKTDGLHPEHVILQKLQLIHEDLARISQDTPHLQLLEHDIRDLKEHLREVEESMIVLMETTGRTFTKVDNVETSVEVLKDRGN